MRLPATLPGAAIWSRDADFVIPFPVIDPVLVQVGPLRDPLVRAGLYRRAAARLVLCAALVADAALWGRQARARPPRISTICSSMPRSASCSAAGSATSCSTISLVSLPTRGEILAVWHGGMSFHGGLIGAALAMVVLARRRKLPVLALARRRLRRRARSACSSAASPTSSTASSGAASRTCPGRWCFRPAGPSRATRASSTRRCWRGCVLFVAAGRRHPAPARCGGRDSSTGLLRHRLRLARIVCEFFREPDPQLGFLVGGRDHGHAAVAADDRRRHRPGAARPRAPAGGGARRRVTPLGREIARLIAAEGPITRRALHGALPRPSRARLLHDPRSIRRGGDFVTAPEDQPDVRRADRPVVRRRLAARWARPRRSASSSSAPAAAR